jgi:hypothetical protein
VRIIYGVDGQLREGDTVLATFDEGGASPWGCLCVGDRRYEIARHKDRGWHFRLVDCDTGEDVCEYVPFRIVRGGHLLGASGSVTLLGAALRPRRWSFASDAGGQVNARVASTQKSRRFGEGLTLWGLWFASKAEGANVTPPPSEPEVGVESPKSLSWFEVELTGLPLVHVPADVATVLAFGCWVLVERRSMKLPLPQG